MSAAAARAISSSSTFLPTRSTALHPSFSAFLKLPTITSTKCPTQFFSTIFQPHRNQPPLLSPPKAAPSSSPKTTFHGVCYVVGDNIDTDQIIPTQYLTLVPTNLEEYKRLGSCALSGLPSSYPDRFVGDNKLKSEYSVVIAGANFGCGSSREHAPVALGAAGATMVVAESYSRLFFRNSVSTGEVYPLECESRICEECKTGDVITVELEENRLINRTTGKEFKLKPVGDAGPVIKAGGIFAYARDTGMIPSSCTA